MVSVLVLVSCSGGPAALTLLPASSARFHVPEQAGVAPFTVNFSVDRERGDVYYHWDFGDGNTGAGPSPVHVYTKAGAFTVRLQVLNEDGAGPSLAASTQRVTVRPGPLSTVRLVPAAEVVLTGDTLPVALEAVDEFGNPVQVDAISWEADSGALAVGPDGAAYTAGREPGQARIIASVQGEGGTFTAETVVPVEPGYCVTERRHARWQAEWLPAESLNVLTRTTLEPAFSLYEAPSAAEGAGRMKATASVLVQRQGPVLFEVDALGHVVFRVNGVRVLGNAGGEALLDLEPGVHQLELQYTWDGAMRVAFAADGDVLEWDAVLECHGTYVVAPQGRYSVWETSQPVDQIADRFSISPDDLVSVDMADGSALLLPGSASSGAKVIFVHGLGSRTTCAPDDRAQMRARTVAHAVQLAAWETTGHASILDADDFITFSYAGTYVNCGNGRAYSAAEGVPPIVAQAVYASRDTCVGVETAAERLGDLVDGIRMQAPETRVYLVGHSLGGMVGAYYLASRANGSDAVQALVTLDSPLDGYQGLEVRLPCAVDSPSRRDLRGDTHVVETIAGLRQTQWAERLLAINSTFVGAAVGPQVLDLDCRTSRVQRDNWFTILFGDVLDAVSEWVEGHDCGFTHPDSLAAIARVINGTPGER